MGSRRIHHAIAVNVLDELPGVDRNRFLLGSLLPDAAFDENGRSHWKIHFLDVKKEYIALTVPICLAELNALQTGGGFVDEIALAWS